MMDVSLKQRFLDLWFRYFPAADLPLAFYYTDDPTRAPLARPAGRQCFVCKLAEVREGASYAFDVEAVGCGGGKRYLGFVPDLRPGFEYFLSCGIPGEMEGERYKSSPELVRELLKNMPELKAPARTIVFKRWDNLDADDDDPAVVVFFATPDVLSGLFTLAGYDEARPQAVVAPFGAGCASIVYYPYLEGQTDRPRAVLGMFDVSARPCVSANVLTLAIPWPRFVRMVGSAEESFLITGSWDKVRTRIKRQAAASAD